MLPATEDQGVAIPNHWGVEPDIHVAFSILRTGPKRDQYSVRVHEVSISPFWASCGKEIDITELGKLRKMRTELYGQRGLSGISTLTMARECCSVFIPVFGRQLQKPLQRQVESCLVLLADEVLHEIELAYFGQRRNGSLKLSVRDSNLTSFCTDYARSVRQQVPGGICHPKDRPKWLICRTRLCYCPSSELKTDSDRDKVPAKSRARLIYP